MHREGGGGRELLLLLVESQNSVLCVQLSRSKARLSTLDEVLNICFVVHLLQGVMQG